MNDVGAAEQVWRRHRGQTVTSRAGTLDRRPGVRSYYQGAGNKNGSKEIIAGNLITDITDHFPNFILVKNNKMQIVNKTNRPMVRLYTAANKQKFRQDLELVDWGTDLVKGVRIRISFVISLFMKLGRFLIRTFRK